MNEIKPALTAEEWADTKCAVGVWWENGKLWNDGRIEERPHALAATCLHHQPFGFTRDEADFQRLLGRASLIVAVIDGKEVAFDPAVVRLVGEKLNALLPRREVDQ